MKPTQRSISLQGLYLLLVENDPPTQCISTEMLTLDGVQVTAASSAAEALKTLQEGTRYDAALVNFDPPNTDGITLIQQLTHDYPTPSLIDPSAHVIDETLGRRTSALSPGIIQKPVLQDELS